MRGSEYRRAQLLQLLAQGPRSTEELCEELECGVATLRRDVKYLREELEIPIRARQRGNRYVYELPLPPEEVPELLADGSWLSQEDLETLLLALAILKQPKGSPLAPLARPLVRRLQEICRLYDIDPDRFEVQVVTRPVGARPAVEPQTFLKVVRATMRNRALEIRYHNRYDDREATRVVDPQRLLFHRETWYLLAWCHRARALRVFALDRITGLQELGPVAHQLPPDEIEAALAGALGPFLGASTRRSRQWAVLRFSAYKSRWIADEFWHPEQELRELPDGRCELKVPYTDERPLIYEILRHGGDVEVLRPKSLREAVRAELSRALAHYESP